MERQGAGVKPASLVQLFPVDIEHGFYDTLRGYDSSLGIGFCFPGQGSQSVAWDAGLDDAIPDK